MRTIKTQAPKLNIVALAKPIVTLAKASVSSTAELAQALLKADTVIQRTFKGAERGKQRQKLTATVLKLSRLSKDAKRSLSSTMSQIFRVAGAVPSIRREWVAGKYGKHTISHVRRLSTKSRRRSRVPVSQVVALFVKKQALNVFKLDAFITEMSKLARRVRDNVARKSWKRAIRFDRNKYGLTLA